MFGPEKEGFVVTVWLMIGAVWLGLIALMLVVWHRLILAADRRTLPPDPQFDIPQQPVPSFGAGGTVPWPRSASDPHRPVRIP